MVRAAGRHAREVEALAPDQHQVGILGQGARAVVLQCGNNAQAAARVGILVRADEQAVVEPFAGLRRPVLLDQGGEARAERRA